MKLFLLLALLFAPAASTLQPSPSCTTKCGNVTIEYPFATSPKCYHDERFLINCNKTRTGKKPFLGGGDIEVLSISLNNGELRVLMDISRSCYNSTGHRIDSDSYFYSYEFNDNFVVSSKKNKVTVVGCDSYVYLNKLGVRNSSSGCMAVCNSLPPNDECSGDGCCQAPIPTGANDFSLEPDSFNNHTDVLSFNPCSYAFIAEVDSFNFSPAEDLKNLRNKSRFPVVLDWSIGDTSCDQLGNISLCKENSKCVNSTSRSGYTCQCLEGFEGNPYLPNPNGCKDTDECKTGNHTCAKHEICRNTIGSFRCKKRLERSIILLGSIIGFLVFLVFVFGVCGLKLKLKNQKLTKLREKHFEQNGGIMLTQLLSADSSNPIKIYTKKEIKIATNDYHKSRIIGKGGQGIVYKGILPDKSEVAIKRARIGDCTQVKQFINEVVILSRITNTKVVKLLGCCLETEVPFLVYEFVSGGTLSEKLHGAFLPWKDRLRIAVEIAETLSSLHSSHVPIIHRDIKPTNILLDDKLSVKLADFGASRLVPIDKEQLTTLVLGTFGYLDPEYFHRGIFSEKSDVYSFGVVLLELVSGEKALCFDRPQRHENLVTRLDSALNGSRLDEFFDTRVVNEVNHMEIQEVALLAVKCTRVKGDQRPNMKEVAEELEGLRASAEKDRFEFETEGMN